VSLARKTLPARRQPMKRVPIAKGDKPLKRAKPMAKRSTKRKAEDREVNDLAEFAEFFIAHFSQLYGYRCWLCRDKPATAIHHITGRASSLRHHRCNLFATCDNCHEEIIPLMGVRAVFEIKKLRDWPGFDRDIAAQLLRAKGQGVL